MIQRKRNMFLATVLIIFLLVSAVSVIYFLSRGQGQKNRTNSSNTLDPLPSKNKNWQCGLLKKYKFSFCYPVSWKANVTSMIFGSKSGFPDNSEGFEVNLMNDPKYFESGQGAGFGITIYPKNNQESAEDFIHRFFGDKKNSLVISLSPIKIGNAKNVYYISDDTIYRRETGQIFPISPARLFIERPGAVWDYEKFYQNAMFDIRPYEPTILESFNFQD